MTNLYIDDFKLGLDVRKSVLTAQPGSLRVLDNCVLTDGGEVEKRRAFVHVADLPAGSKGLHGSSSSGVPLLWTWTMGAGTPGTNTFVAAITGGASIFSQLLAVQGTDNAFLGVNSVSEYGSKQFFVTGITAATLAPPTRNWWLGVGVPDYLGIPSLVNGQKMYRGQGTVLYFSGVGDPSATNPLNPGGTGPNTVNPGAGFIDVSHLDNDFSYIVGMEQYFKQIAVFGRRATLMFALDPDPANNVVEQVLRIGSTAFRSIRQFGTGDVLFLSDSGIRSLRVQNTSLAAGVTDIGSPIDKLLRTKQQDLGEANVSQYGRCIIEPITGRYWLALKDKIYVLSYWPSAKISAWSTFTPGFDVDAMTVSGNRVYLRSGDAVYQYGGATGDVCDTSVATMRTPLHAADTPTTKKKSISIGAMVQGNWALSVCMDPDNPTTFEPAANLAKSTYGMELLPFAGFSTHIGFQLTCADAALSIVGAINTRFDKSTEE